MPRLKLHFDGWLALPPGFLRRLGLHAGDELEAELAGNTIVLRSAKGVVRPGTKGVAAEAAAALPAPSVLAAPPEEARPGPPATSPDMPPVPKRRGRPPGAKG